MSYALHVFAWSHLQEIDIPLGSTYSTHNHGCRKAVVGLVCRIACCAEARFKVVQNWRLA